MLKIEIEMRFSLCQLRLTKHCSAHKLIFFSTLIVGFFLYFKPYNTMYNAAPYTKSTLMLAFNTKKKIITPTPDFDPGFVLSVCPCMLGCVTIHLIYKCPINSNLFMFKSGHLKSKWLNIRHGLSL